MILDDDGETADGRRGTALPSTACFGASACGVPTGWR